MERSHQALVHSGPHIPMFNPTEAMRPTLPSAIQKRAGARTRPELSVRNIDEAAPSGRLTALDLPLKELEIDFDPQERIFWQWMKPEGRPSYTLGMLREIRRSLDRVQAMFVERAGDPEPAVKYVVMGSKMPGIFNLGGDLPLFADRIRAGDGEALRHYAHSCIELQYDRAVNQELPYISISLVQGDALGGGFECCLADDLIIAERSAKFGLPEILFNLFPGMGAYSFLSRRLDPVQAERMILSGKIYKAEELQEIGLVDEVVDDGKGIEAVYAFAARNRRRFQARRAVYQARRLARPITLEELTAITDLWVDAALTLDPGDLRKMERLAAAQDRRRRR